MLWVAFTTRTRPAPEVIGAVMAAVVGVALLSEVTSVELSSLDGFGLMMGISSAFFFAAYTLLSEQANERYGAVGAMFRAFAVTASFWLIVQAFRGWPAELLEPSNLPRVLYVGVFGTIVPFLLYVWGIGHVRSERASIAATLEPALAGIIAWLWLDQVLSGVQIAGAVLVLGAVIALQIERKEQVLAPEP
ncbi:MAG: EamA family transporter [Actinomycetota bacterium]